MSQEENRLSGSWSFPTPIYFGPGRIRELGEICIDLSIRRPLLVTDNGTVKLSFVGEIESILQAAGVRVAVFSDVVSNPTDANILEGVDAYRNHDCDGVIALGGGSGIDAGKAIALMAGQARPIEDFEDKEENWKRVDISGMAPCIAIPTTAGTGSEVGRASVIVDTSRREKRIIFHPRMLPISVICDPELTLALPSWLTAATGLDAFTHCFEAFCVHGYHPMADGIALKGMQLAARWLPVAFENGSDIEARSHMMSAASMGAVAFQKGLGAVHALSHAVGAYYDTHHGLTNAVFLPYVMIRNRSVIEEKMTEVAVAIGLQNQSFDAVLAWLIEFRARLGIPNDAGTLGVADGDLDILAAKSVRDPALSGNPIALDQTDLRELLSNARGGRLSG